MTGKQIISRYNATIPELEMLSDLVDISNISPVEVILNLSTVRALSRHLCLNGCDGSIEGCRRYLGVSAAYEGIVKEALDKSNRRIETA